MPIAVVVPRHHDVDNMSFTLRAIAELSRKDFLALLNADQEVPTDGKGLIRAAAVLLSIFAFDGLVSYGLLKISKEQGRNESAEFKCLLKKSLKERLKSLYQLSGIEAPLDRDPFQAVLSAVKLRDQLVHPKLEERVEEYANPNRNDLFEVMDGSLKEFYDPIAFAVIMDKLDEAKQKVLNECDIEDELARARVE